MLCYAASAFLLPIVTTLSLSPRQTSVSAASRKKEAGREESNLHTHPSINDNAQTQHLKCAESDLKSAIGKLTEGALQYDRASKSADQLGAFRGATMSPYILKVLHCSIPSKQTKLPQHLNLE